MGGHSAPWYLCTLSKTSSSCNTRVHLDAFGGFRISLLLLPFFQKITFNLLFNPTVSHHFLLPAHRLHLSSSFLFVISGRISQPNILQHHQEETNPASHSSKVPPLFTLLFLSSLFYPFSCPPPFSKFDLVRSLHHVHQLYPLHLLFLLFLFQFPLFVSSSSSSSSSSFPFFLPSFRDLSHSRSYFSSCCLSSDCSPCKVCITIFPLCHHFLHRTQVEGVLGPSPWLFSFKSSRVFHDSEDTVDSVCTEQTTYSLPQETRHQSHVLRLTSSCFHCARRHRSQSSSALRRKPARFLSTP